MNTIKIILTPDQEKWLIAHFKHTKNEEIAKRLGVSETTVHRFARKLGLKKTARHMKATQRNAADKAQESHRRNGTYPPKGYIIPGSEEHRFKKGVTSYQRLGKRKERKRIERSFRIQETDGQGGTCPGDIRTAKKDEPPSGQAPTLYRLPASLPAQARVHHPLGLFRRLLRSGDGKVRKV